MEDSSKKRSFTKTKKNSGPSDSKSRKSTNEKPLRKKASPASTQWSDDRDEKPRRRRAESDSSDRPRTSTRKYADSEKGSGDRDERPRRRRTESDSSDRPRTSTRKYSDSKRGSDDRDERPRRGRTGSDSSDRPRTSTRKYADSKRGGDDHDERPRRGRTGSDSSDRPRTSTRKYADSKRGSDSRDERPWRGRTGSDSDRLRTSTRKYADSREHAEGEAPPYRKHSVDDKLKRRREFSEGKDEPRRSFKGRNSSDRKPAFGKDSRKRGEEKTEIRRRRRDVTAESAILTEIVEKRIREGRQAPQKQKILSLEYEEQYGPIRLNKYIANSGICSRRDADMLITSGAIKVNGKVVTELGTKVMPTDEVRYEDKILQREKPVYILLNKPKDYITTTYDERDRKDVMELIRGACKERVYPVGRLDKNTTGLLLFTNNGEMAKKLTHPKHKIVKTYHVELSKNLSASDFDTIITGFDLDDGFIKADDLAYVNDSKKEVGITIHSGRNRIVRRIFEHLGYDIIKLDRVVFAGLTKKNLPRAKWRFLTEAEVNILSMI